METLYLLGFIIILICIIPLAYIIGKGTGYALGFNDAKQVYKKDSKPVTTDGKVNQLAQNICNSYNMN
jgi:hypothetical protein